MKKIVSTSLVSAAVIGVVLTVTGSASALVSTVRYGRGNGNGHVRNYGKNRGHSISRHREYGNPVRCEEFEFESEVESAEEENEVRLRRGNQEDVVAVDNETNVSGGNWKDLKNKPTVKIKGEKCDDDPKPVGNSITIIKKNKKNDD